MQISYDGNSNEKYLQSSEAFSKAASHKLFIAMSTAIFNNHPRLGYVRTYTIDKIQPYEKRAFAWHHDGWGNILIKVMILLSDVAEDGQRMKYCPGTQNFDWDCQRSK